MRSVLQRVEWAAVSVDGIEIARIGKGILALVAMRGNDNSGSMEWMADKIIQLRIFDDSEGRLNLSLQDVGGQLLVVSQFTLYGDCHKGRRPSYSEAAPLAQAQQLYNEFMRIVRNRLPEVQCGRFQASMEVSLSNSGPVTLIVDSPQPESGSSGTES